MPEESYDVVLRWAELVDDKLYRGNITSTSKFDQSLTMSRCNRLVCATLVIRYNPLSNMPLHGLECCSR